VRSGCGTCLLAALASKRGLHTTKKIAGLSLLATRRLLLDVSKSFSQIAPWGIDIESMGGVDAGRFVRGDKPIDLVVLPSHVMEQLEDEGWVDPGSCFDIARSGVAIAVRSGLPRPAIATENDVKQAVLDARKICYSAGPSGDHVKRLLKRWNIADAIADRTVEATSGVPVSQLLTSGEADLGFQQFSEFLDVDGIDIVGRLPANIQAITVFTAGVSSRAEHRDGARAFIAYLTSPATQAAKQRFGMEAAG
jgi:molybdate transport system substrate-binding protein